MAASPCWPDSVRVRSFAPISRLYLPMATVDEATAAAIRTAFDRGGELSAVVELRRYFPLIADNEQARACVRTIASWKPLLPRPPRARRRGN